jgi:hypothetical protein
MNSKNFRPFARSLLFAVSFSRFAASFARDEAEPLKPVLDSLEDKASKLCGG